MSGLPSRPLPPGITHVEGCDCGGLNMHLSTCSIWSLNPEQIKINQDRAVRRLDAYTAGLNAELAPSASGNWEHARHAEQDRVIGSLLAGEAMLFGKRVEIAWPDGMPQGMTTEWLVDLGRKLMEGT